LWGTISEELEIPEIMGDVATGVGWGVHKFCPKAKKTETLLKRLIVLCLTTTNRRRISSEKKKNIVWTNYINCCSIN
jgi:hypothetical protein